MNEQRQELEAQVKAYLDKHEKSSMKFSTTIRGSLELRTEQIRVLLDALCCYHSPNEEKMELRDELFEKFFIPPKLLDVSCPYVQFYVFIPKY